MLCGLSLHAAPDGAGYVRNFGSYKHVAPPEQEPLDTGNDGFVQSIVDFICTKGPMQA